MDEIIKTIKEFYPDCNDIQLAYIESQIKTLIEDTKREACDNGWHIGRAVGHREGVRYARLAAASKCNK